MPTATADDTRGKTLTCKGALLWETGPNARFSVEEVRIDPPKAPELRVKLSASGICHSDEHLRAGDYSEALPWTPVLGGHEGSGIVESVGDEVSDIAPGDHVVFSFIPSCGRCEMCSSGHTNLCDLGSELFSQTLLHDHTNRIHAGDTPVGTFLQLGTFAEYATVNRASVVKIDNDLPLEKAALVGCGVTTGWGSATYAAGTQTGDICVVVGIGGVGINAVQGFRAAGARHIIVVDPIEWKCKDAIDKFGATHAASSLDEAFSLIQELSWGKMADRIVFSVGSVDGADLDKAMKLLGLRGVLVFTAVARADLRDVKFDLFTLTHYEQQVRGSLYGSSNPRRDVPRMLMNWRAGQLNLEDLITQEYSLDQINEGFSDLLSNKNFRGVIRYDR
ncbi:NDMA-dependent alcohol dehydrogenase [Rhodococcus fascians]|nr:NDMA-dependent alcohol dehydrogenase [Rhodococcus fascians]MBY3995231.1 NDMA-dependent alcohol dehydrogenase [Rhodococcus fascians]MBY4000449.1 NDMA-dependent alcohol dehydrogenase [Rhodococcus fascians]MBY4005477.1 NDMA-dependent alcohol dehydrogenase [Rhodococcus fascians]MBY4016310.1 NDMA-dependent alcohol dehydrogenase [Rhodococcus fascians]